MSLETAIESLTEEVIKLQNVINKLTTTSSTSDANQEKPAAKKSTAKKTTKKPETKKVEEKVEEAKPEKKDAGVDPEKLKNDIRVEAKWFVDNDAREDVKNIFSKHAGEDNATLRKIPDDSLEDCLAELKEKRADLEMMGE